MILLLFGPHAFSWAFLLLEVPKEVREFPTINHVLGVQNISRNKDTHFPLNHTVYPFL